MRKRLLLAVAVLVFVAFVLWPRGPRMELYTSPPLAYFGGTLRFQALVPAGWTAGHPTVIQVRGDRPGKAYPWVQISPPPPSPNLKSWFRKYMGEPDEAIAAIVMTGGWDQPHGPRAPGEVIVADGTLIGTRTARREIGGNPGGTIGYSRNRADEFEATYRQICESFKVIR
jgi:hypothetical protein